MNRSASNQQATLNGGQLPNQPATESFANEANEISTEYVNDLKAMISSLLENQMALSAALDETRETCDQLNLVSQSFTPQSSVDDVAVKSFK